MWSLSFSHCLFLDSNLTFSHVPMLSQYGYFHMNLIIFSCPLSFQPQLGIVLTCIWIFCDIVTAWNLHRDYEVRKGMENNSHFPSAENAWGHSIIHRDY